MDESKSKSSHPLEQPYQYFLFDVSLFKIQVHYDKLGRRFLPSQIPVYLFSLLGSEATL